VRSAELEILMAGAQELGVVVDESQGRALLALVDALEAGNARFNLTAIRDRPGMLRKHVLDSLTVQPFVRGAVADVGTGAGFPGLPLAIVNPDLRFTLIESTGKKARFAAQTAADLALANVEVVNARAEDYRPRRPFDTVMARALASLADFVAYAGHLCATEGRMLAMKGRRPDAEIAALSGSFHVSGIHRLRVPGLDDERHVVELSATRPPSRPS
jgi:16S rRNA (guanine527-N7)-methyltransferase